MALFKAVTEVILSLEKSVLGGVESLSSAEENQLGKLVEELCKDSVSVKQELELTQKVYQFSSARYHGNAAQVKIPENAKLHVVYDLDDCLIKSTQLAENEARYESASRLKIKSWCDEFTNF